MATFRPIVAGTWTVSSIRIRSTPAPATPSGAASCTTRASSTRPSSVSRRVRHWPWTRSSVSCWRRRGRCSNVPASTRRPCGARTSESSRGRPTTIMRPDVHPMPVENRRPSGHGGIGECALGAGVLCVRLRGAVRHGGHGLFLVPGGAASGRAGAAGGGVLDGAGRWRHGDAQPRPLRGLLAAAGPCGGRSVQVFRGRGGRHRFLRGRGCAVAGAVVGRGAAWAPGAGCGAGFGGESGRCVQRSDGAERSVAAAGDPADAEQCWPDRGRCGCGGGARYGDDAW